jgi:hypothetical protein
MDWPDVKRPSLNIEMQSTKASPSYKEPLKAFLNIVDTGSINNKVDVTWATTRWRHQQIAWHTTENVGTPSLLNVPQNFRDWRSPRPSHGQKTPHAKPKVRFTNRVWISTH